MRNCGKTLILPIILVSALAGSGCASSAREWPYVVEIGGAKVNVEVAVTPDELARGLMYRDELGDDWGMLFVYDREQTLGFWMKDTKVPLSISFIDKGLIVRDIKDMAPETEDVRRSSVPAMYALEVNRGWFAKHGIEVGAPVKFSKGLEEYIRARRAEIRNPKPETRLKPETEGKPETTERWLPLAHRVSRFGFQSGLWFRVSGFSAVTGAGHRVT